MQYFLYNTLLMLQSALSSSSVRLQPHLRGRRYAQPPRLQPAMILALLDDEIPISFLMSFLLDLTGTGKGVEGFTIPQFSVDAILLKEVAVRAILCHLAFL